jgi:amino acid adenylation domain-containing protein
MRYLLHDGLEAVAAADPDRIAAVANGRMMTYGELDGRANQLARLLLDAGTSKGDRVGLYVAKSLEALVGVYGALKAGAVYVPLDPHAPPARLKYIVRDCGIRVLLSGVEVTASWPELMSADTGIDHLVVLNAGDEGVDPPAGARVTLSSELDGYEPTPPPRSTISLDLAYILYTSGSTGDPKGVMLSHLNGLSFVEWAVREMRVAPDDRLSSHAPFHFDLSIFDIFAASVGGATVVLVPPEVAYFPIDVARFIERERITIWYSVPSVLSMLVTRGNLTRGRFPALRTVLFAGEVFPTKYLRRLMDLLPAARFCNLYGPTETNVCTWYDVPPLAAGIDEPIPIGRAIEGDEVFAVTEDGRRADAGELGELHVRGLTVMQGYWGDPAKTSRSLVPSPLGTAGREPVYRTGDLVVEQPDGTYRLLGRRDHQIKSRGYRIELGEIETAIYSHPDVVECAAIAVPDPVITNRVKALVVTRNDVMEEDLTRTCRQRLPRYMIPESFEFRGSLPRTSTGKIDRRTLSEELLAEAG